MRKPIESGFIKRTIVKEVAYEMRMLEKSDIENMVELQNLVAAGLKNPQTFVVDSKEFILTQVLDDGMGRAIGVFAEGRLVAFRTITFSGNDEYHLGRELNIPEDELDYVVHLEATVVHPEFRGNRLQAKMMTHTFDIIDKLGYYHVCCTIHPFNYPSLKNVMDSGLAIEALDRRVGSYEGKWRFLLHRDMRQNDAQQYKNCIEIENGRIRQQQELLDKGYVGFLLIRDNYAKEEFKIRYGMPL